MMISDLESASRSWRYVFAILIVTMMITPPSYAPNIRCGVVCGDFGGWPVGMVDLTDYLILLSEYGLTWPASVNKGCLDLINDGIININDLMAWEIEGMLLCPDRLESNQSSINESLQFTGSYTGTGIGIFEPLVIFGKPVGDGILLPDDYLYSMQSDGTVVEVTETGAHGRLLADVNGDVYQIDRHGMLVHLSSGSVVFRPATNMIYGDSSVSIGFGADGGVPVMDAAFSPTDPDVVYVVPVLVTPKGDGRPYRAAAKLTLSGSITDPNYTVDMLYGMDPNYRPDRYYHIREQRYGPARTGFTASQRN